MEVHAVEVRAVNIGEDLVRLVLKSLRAQNLHLQNNDVLALASKIISYAERRLVRLSEIDASEKAVVLSKEYCLKPAFAELILREANEIYGGVDKAVLTLKNNVLAANAGIDNKNTPDDFVVLWPNNPRARCCLLFLEHLMGGIYSLPQRLILQMACPARNLDLRSTKSSDQSLRI